MNWCDHTGRPLRIGSRVHTVNSPGQHPTVGTITEFLQSVVRVRWDRGGRSGVKPDRLVAYRTGGAP